MPTIGAKKRETMGSGVRDVYEVPDTAAPESSVNTSTSTSVVAAAPPVSSTSSSCSLAAPLDVDPAESERGSTKPAKCRLK